MLTHPLYAGYITHKNWNIKQVKGNHEALISFETFQRIQQRRQSVARIPTRKNINADFPLRGFVTCGHCDQPFTACWSKGQYRRYAYYLCDTKGCKMHRKSIRREELEGDFETLLTQLQPSQALFAMAFTMFKELWDNKLSQAKSTANAMRKQLINVDQQSELFLDRIMNAQNPTVIEAYEKRIDELQTQKTILQEKITNCGKPTTGFEQTYRTAFAFLENPHKLWASNQLEDRRALLKLVFTDNLSYTKNQGYRTAKTTLPFKALGSIQANENKMVPWRRLELPLPYRN